MKKLKAFLAAFLIATFSCPAEGAGSGYSPFGWQTWKAPVNSSSLLPTSGNLPGDVRIDLTTFDEWLWNGSAWISIGGSGAILSLGNFDSQAATAKGAALVAGVLSMQSASTSAPGLVNTTAQSFLGNKAITDASTAAATPSAGFSLFGQGTVQNHATSYGSSANFVGRSSNGTFAAPTASTTDDLLAAFGGRGYGATGFPTTSRGAFRINAAEPWTDTAQGSYLVLRTTPIGGTATAEIARFTDTGSLGVGTSTPVALIEASGTSPDIFSTAYASNGNFVGRRADGTSTVPTAVQANEIISNFGGSGYGATAFSSGSKGNYRIYAAENWTDAAQGTYLRLSTTPIGSTSLTERMRITDAGLVNISGLTASQSVLTDSSKNLISNPVTGSGSSVLATSPTLVSPALGTPTALVGTNITGTASGFTAGNATNTAITDDTSTNAIMYPTWVTSNSGNLPQKVSSTNLVFNPSASQLIVGYNSATDTNITAPETALVDIKGSANALLTMTRYSNANTGATVQLRKSRSATVGTGTVITTGDTVGSLQFSAVGTDGLAYTRAAQVDVQAEGTIGSAIIPGLFRVLTANSSGALTLGMSINSAQLVTVPGTLTVTGAITPTGGIVGTATNNNATAGNVGEYVESLVTSYTNIPGATTAWADLTSISLTAGDWDVTGFVDWSLNGSVQTVAQIGISTTSGNSSTGLVDGNNMATLVIATAAQNRAGVIPSYRMSLAGTTTVYLKLNATYTVATPQYVCRLSARRVR